ncbi:efflux RND transporter periplasmic adaptor subunit [Ammoniphilus sp. CFH 90114]|uniref:efflux RND transporter periplasmic adaptor subunit n=1 Tax=Ammoniphilus sp. CFH 90114 TaxID=2493665 RepID=UPI00100F2408|nr:efflux RND transporter periplasmic adaptor subunit [Ammoniphilus sp. CFH 90114]RXT13709.1 efflux RND transporter periplasmic adaptor subunit [Ammoniphilus sp. CFH 90114]
MKTNRYILISILAFSVTLSACTKAEPVIQSAEEQVVPVQVEKVSEGTIEERASITGKLSPDEAVDVSPKVSGKIQKINVSLGQFVQQGEVLFTLDQTDLANSVKQAEAAYRLSLANLKQAESGAVQGIDQAESSVIQYQNAITQAQNAVTQQEQALQDATMAEQRTRQLHTAGAVPNSELERVETALKNAQIGLANAQTSLENAKLSYDNAKKNLEHAKNKNGVQVTKASVDQARVALENAQSQLVNATVTAPITGIVSIVHGSTGQIVGPQSPVVSMARMDPVKVKTNVSEQELTQIQVGSNVNVEIPTLNKQLEAKVTAVSPIMNNDVKAYPVEISIPNSNLELKADMVVHVRFGSGSGEKLTLIPRKALVEEQGKRFVYKLEENKAMKVEVTTGTETSEQVEIKEGLHAGDQVVVKGQTLLVDGVKVDVQENTQ